MGCGGGCSQSHWPSSNRPRLRGVNGVFADAPLFEGVLKGILSGQSASKTGGLGSHVMRGGRVLSPGFGVVGFIKTSVTAPRLHFCLELDPCPSHLPGLQQETRPDLGARVRSCCRTARRAGSCPHTGHVVSVPRTLVLPLLIPRNHLTSSVHTCTVCTMSPPGAFLASGRE